MFDFEFSEMEPKAIGHSMSRYTRNSFLDSLAKAGISAAAGIFGGLSEKEPEQQKQVVLPKTVSGQIAQDMNFLFDLESSEAMKGLTEQLNDWAGQDRQFFENTFQPFQASLIEANQALIPGIVANAGEAMKSSLKDLMGGDFLKESFRAQMGESGADISKFAESFSKQIDNIPTAEQRVGEAVSGIEQRFGEAGAELKRQMGAQGLNVSQASKRELAIEKAKAKAGAVGVAKEAARTEQLAGAQAGVQVAAGVQSGQANLLASQQQLTQAGASLTPQIGGVQQTAGVGEAGQLGAQLAQAGAEKVLGTTTDTKSADFTQPGIVTPRFFDKETGKMVDAAGNPMPATSSAVSRPMQMGTQATGRDRRVNPQLGGPGVGGADSDGSNGADTGGMGGGSPGTGGGGGGPTPGTGIGGR